MKNKLQKIILGAMIAGLSSMSFAEESTGGVNVGGNVIPACSLTQPNYAINFGANSGPQVLTSSLTFGVSCPFNSIYIIEATEELAWAGATNTVIRPYADANFTQAYANNPIGMVSSGEIENHTIYFAVTGVSSATKLPAGGTSTLLNSITESGTITGTINLRLTF